MEIHSIIIHKLVQQSKSDWVHSISAVTLTKNKYVLKNSAVIKDKIMSK